MKNTTGDNWTQKVRLSPAMVFNEHYIAVIAKTTCLGSTRRYHIYIYIYRDIYIYIDMHIYNVRYICIYIPEGARRTRMNECVFLGCLITLDVFT